VKSELRSNPEAVMASFLAKLVNEQDVRLLEYGSVVDVWLVTELAEAAKAGHPKLGS
jgi:hypothetical protein